MNGESLQRSSRCNRAQHLPQLLQNENENENEPMPLSEQFRGHHFPDPEEAVRMRGEIEDSLVLPNPQNKEASSILNLNDDSDSDDDELENIGPSL